MNVEDQTKLLIQPNGEELNFRTGNLPESPVKVKNSISGVITAPGDYFQKKYIGMKSDMYPLEGMLVNYSVTNGNIVFSENYATNIGGCTITGKLELESNLSSLGINTKKCYSPSELSETLKMLRVLFGDKDQWTSIVTNLKNFTAEATSKIEKENDDKGNRKDNIVQSLKTNFDLSFSLSAPVFQGFYTKNSFKVEILVNVRSSALEMYLQSVELKEIIDTSSFDIITKELSKFEDMIPIVQIS